MVFPANSRYQNVDTTKLVLPDDTEIEYLKRRFLPAPDSLSVMQLHQVTEGDRLDNIAAKFIGDPEQFWRICDANGAMRPDELTEVVGRQLKIAFPAGIPGARVV
jgi:hypothetical protein